MAVKYVRSTTGNDANGGTSWADAYATVGKALSVVAAGDTVYVSQVHAETGAVALTLNPPTASTAANPVLVLCVNDANTPPTATATTATISTTGASNITLNSLQGFIYWFGITFQAGSAANAASIAVLGVSNAPAGAVFDTCKFTLNNSSASSTVSFGGDATSINMRALWMLLINTPVQFGAAGQTVNLRNVELYWENTASAVQGTTPTTLLTGTVDRSFNRWTLSGLDLSALGSGKNLVAVADAGGVIYLRNCKLGAAVTVKSGTIPDAGQEIYLDNCDSGNTNYRMEHYKYQGSIVTETTKVRSGGASDGTTTISHNFTSLSTGPSLFAPLEGPWISIWNDTSGSSKTATIELCTENVVLTNADVYLEVEYLGTAGFPESVYANSRVTDVFATPSNLTTSAASWAGFTVPKPQKIALAFTPQVKGPIRARVCLVKSNATVYVDPLLTVA